MSQMPRNVLSAEGPEAVKLNRIEHIRIHYADLLGEDAKLLDEPADLEKLSAIVRAKLAQRPKAA